MRVSMTCREVQELIAGYHGGWLGEPATQGVQEHLAHCQACATEARRDAILTQALGILADAPVEAPRWYAPGSQRTLIHRPRFTLAMATAVVALVFVVAADLLLHTPAAPPTRPAVPAVMTPAAGTSSNAWVEAQYVASLGDLGTDPNRLVALIQMGRPQGARQ